jgi:mannose-6-phosphate isomerase-like protein (cupin superfamily)
MASAPAATLAATLPFAYAPPAGRGAAPAPVAPRARVLDAGAGTTRRVGGETVTLKVAADETGGAFSLFEVACAPGAGASLRRDACDAVLVVLDGELAVTVDGEERRAAAGACVVVPRGAAHAYANRGARPARALLVSAPGGARERMVAALAAHEAIGGPGGGPADVNAAARICAAHGVEVLAGVRRDA